MNVLYRGSWCRGRHYSGNVTTAPTASMSRKVTLMGSRIGTGYFIYLFEA